MGGPAGGALSNTWLRWGWREPGQVKRWLLVGANPPAHGCCLCGLPVCRLPCHHDKPLACIPHVAHTPSPLLCNRSTCAVHDFGFMRFEPSRLQFMQAAEIPLAPHAASVGLDIRVVGNDSGEKVSGRG